MDSFFRELKTNLVHHQGLRHRDQARRDLFAYLEGFYNRQRLNSALGYRTPAEVERRELSIA